MKITGIRLLQMIKCKEIKDNTKFKVFYTADNEDENTITYRNGDLFWTDSFKFFETVSIDELLTIEFEFIEENKPIEEIKEIRNLIEESFSKLEEAQDKINRLESKMKESDNNE